MGQSLQEVSLSRLLLRGFGFPAFLDVGLVAVALSLVMGPLEGEVRLQAVANFEIVFSFRVCVNNFSHITTYRAHFRMRLNQVRLLEFANRAVPRLLRRRLLSAKAEVNFAAPGDEIGGVDDVMTIKTHSNTLSVDSAY